MMRRKWMQKNNRRPVALNFITDFGVIAAQRVHCDSGYQRRRLASYQPSVSLAARVRSLRPFPGISTDHRLLRLNDNRRQSMLLGDDDPGKNVGDNSGETSRCKCQKDPENADQRGIHIEMLVSPAQTPAILRLMRGRINFGEQ